MNISHQGSITQVAEFLLEDLDRLGSTGTMASGNLRLNVGQAVALETEVRFGEKGGLEFEIKWPYLAPMPMQEALETIQQALSQLDETGALTVRNKTVSVGSNVDADIAIEPDIDLQGRDCIELELDISWPAADGEFIGDASKRLSQALAPLLTQGAVRLGDQEVPLDTLVTLRIEGEGDEAQGEIEMEVNWPFIAQRSLEEAVREISAAVNALRSGDLKAGDKDSPSPEEVTATIEFYGDESEGEIEFKISWEVAKLRDDGERDKPTAVAEAG